MGASKLTKGGGSHPILARYKGGAVGAGRDG